MELNLKLRNDVWQVHGTIILPDGRKKRVRKSTGFPKHLKNLANAQISQIIADALADDDVVKTKADNIAAARYDLALIGTAPPFVCEPRPREINHNIDPISALPKRGNVRRLNCRGAGSPRENRQPVSGGVKRSTGGCANETRATCHQNMHRFPALMSRGNPRASTDVYAS